MHVKSSRGWCGSWEFRGVSLLFKCLMHAGCVCWKQPTNNEKPASHSPAYISPFPDRISADSWVPQTFIKCWNQIQRIKIFHKKYIYL